MMERLKTALLIGLVILSLVQSYLLVYSFPEIGATVRTEQEYISPERMGDPLRIDEVLYPEDMVLHMGGDRHAVLYPETGYYIRIYDQIASGEYRNFQRIPYAMRDWDELRRNTQGVELRFGGAMPVALLQKTMQLDGDILFLNDAIDRIWLMRRNFPGRNVAEIYFFSADGETVYMAARSPLTADEIADLAGLGSYMPAYALWRGDIYLPEEPIETVAYSFGYTSFSPQQMQRSLFFDPNKTRYLEDRQRAGHLYGRQARAAARVRRHVDGVHRPGADAGRRGQSGGQRPGGGPVREPARRLGRPAPVRARRGEFGRAEHRVPAIL